jgi:hypothetical protein
LRDLFLPRALITPFSARPLPPFFVSMTMCVSAGWTSVLHIFPRFPRLNFLNTFFLMDDESRADGCEDMVEREKRVSVFPLPLWVHDGYCFLFGDAHAETIDVKMVVFWCPGVAWQNEAPICFRVVKQRLILRYKFEKELISWFSSSSISQSHWWCLFHKKWRAETLQPGLEFDNLKPRLKSGTFKCISLLNSSFFSGDDRGLLKEGVNDTNVSSLLANFSSVFTSMVYCGLTAVTSVLNIHCCPFWCAELPNHDVLDLTNRIIA